jgi:hypothetical protein
MPVSSQPLTPERRPARSGAIDLPRVSVHAPRHPDASALGAAGPDVVAVSRRPGHDSPGITVEHLRAPIRQRRYRGGWAVDAATKKAWGQGANASFCSGRRHGKHLNCLDGMGGRAVEGSGLENRRACKRTVGSNPTPSARNQRFPAIVWISQFEFGAETKVPPVS